jgi:DNA-binding MarR family transcriptional regulator
MSIENSGDARAVLAREKYFSLRPKPLERWIWQQGIPQAAERVFWMHWEEGMRRGDWCSELALKEVARECAVDTSTVTRAYQVLKRFGLIRREDPGRDPANPYRQAVAVTEVLAPRELTLNLTRFPSRVRAAHPEAATPKQGEAMRVLPAPANSAPLISRAESKLLMNKLSEHERQEFYLATRDRRTAMTFDEHTVLSPEERGRVLVLLTGVSGATPTLGKVTPPTIARPVSYARPRRLTVLEAARVRAAVQPLASVGDSEELFRQVLWSIEEGALRRFDARLALNIALKKIREGAWTRPNRLPPNWLATARPETCSAA